MLSLANKHNIDCTASRQHLHALIFTSLFYSTCGGGISPLPSFRPSLLRSSNETTPPLRLETVKVQLVRKPVLRPAADPYEPFQLFSDANAVSVHSRIACAA